MDHTIGYIIILLSLVLPGGLILWAWYVWKRKLPDEVVGPFRVRYLENSVRPWRHLPEAAAAMEETLRSSYPARVEELLDVWIEVVPYHGLCISKTVPTGYVRNATGVVRRANGTARLESFLGLGAKHWCLVCRQLRVGDTPAMSDAAEGTGDTRDAGASALFHEMCHVVSWKLKGVWNSEHDDMDMVDLERAMQHAYTRKLKAGTSPVA